MTAWGRIRSRAAFTAAASSASAMTGSAPISFNAGAESRDLVSANTACWFALRRRTRGRPIAPLAPAIRILIAPPFNCRAVSRSFVVDRGRDAVIGDDVGDQPRRLGLARVGADDVVGVGRLGPVLAGAVDAEGLALDLGVDRAREDIREDEAGGGMAVRRREAAGAVFHLDDGESLARDIGQLLAEDLLHSRPFTGRGRAARRGRSEDEPRRDD